MEVLDNGKPFVEAFYGDIPFSIKVFRYYAGWADKITGQTIPVGKLIFYTMQEENSLLTDP